MEGCIRNREERLLWQDEQRPSGYEPVVLRIGAAGMCAQPMILCAHL